MRPPVRRVLALDAGTRSLKLLLAESNFGRVRILSEQLVDLQQEGLVSAGEIKAHLQTVLGEYGHPPVALVLPQHLSISQVIELPAAPESEVAQLIEEETIKLSGVSESRIIHDFVRIKTTVPNRQQFWVTVAQEGEVRERIERVGIELQDLCEVTTRANALITAYRATLRVSRRAILVHLGAETTVVVILLAGEPAFAASFQMGGDFFTRGLARLQNCPEDEAESLKRKTDLLNGPKASADFVGIVDGWVRELKRQLGDWFEQNPAVAPDLTAFEMFASGGGFYQPGFIEYLKAKAGLNFRAWPGGSKSGVASVSKPFEVAFGAALQALGHSVPSGSLLPNDYRHAWHKRLNMQKVQAASVLLALVCAVLLGLGTWRQSSVISHKEALLSKVQAGQESVEKNTALTSILIGEYEGIRPVFAAQQNTLDTLKTLALLQQSRSNRSFWYVLLADQQTYFSQPPAPPSTNKPAASIPAPPPGERVGLGAGGSTNLAKPGLIAELCVPEEPEARLLLSQLVKALKQQPLFSKVDQLPDELRRNLADPKVVIPDRHFALTLDFAETDFQPLPRSRKHMIFGPPLPPGKRTARSSTLESPESFP